MDLNKKSTVLIDGIEYEIKDVLNINREQALWDIRVGIKKGNIFCHEELEKALESGVEPEEAIVEWFYNQKVKTFSNFDSVKNPNKEMAVSEVKKLLYIDDLSMVEIVDALSFSLTDNFWKNQILSISGLRKKNTSGIRKIENLRLASLRSKQKKAEESKKPLEKQNSRQYNDLD